jgi:hypothetical protein
MMNRRLGVLLTLALLLTVFVASAQAAPPTATSTKSTTVTVHVVRADGSVFDPVEDDCWVYLYKPKNVTGKQYSEVRETDADGYVTFTKVPVQQMILMVIPTDNYLSPEGYHLSQILPQWYAVVTPEDFAPTGDVSAKSSGAVLKVVYPY